MGAVDVFRLLSVLLVAALLQSALVSQLPVLGVTADLFLIMVVLVALGRGSVSGAVFGAAAGLVADIVFMEPLGMRMLLYVAVGYGLGRIGEEIHPDGVLLLALTVALSSILAQTAYGLFQYVTGPEGMFLTMLRLQIVPRALLDGLVAIPVYLLLVRVRAIPGPDTEPTLFT